LLNEITTSDTTVRLFAGRSLLFGPVWSCSTAAVLFDSNSGDYWVVSADAKKVLEHLIDHGSTQFGALKNLLINSAIESQSENESLETLKALVESRILARGHWYEPAELPDSEAEP
jgi:hypothetical protein